MSFELVDPVAISVLGRSVCVLHYAVLSHLHFLKGFSRLDVIVFLAVFLDVPAAAGR